jgi:5-methylcytosine-specific restriction endonuclease McrA
MTTRDPELWTPAYRRLRLSILDRDNWTCRVRGPKCKGWADTVDHIIERRDGGAVYDPSNMRASCAWCNGWRSMTRTHDLRRAGERRDGPYRTQVADGETRL